MLIQRHQISGIRAFSRDSFAKQLQIPGIVSFRAIRHQQTVGMILWYVQNEVAYYHLGAYTDEGYQIARVICSVSQSTRILCRIRIDLREFRRWGRPL